MSSIVFASDFHLGMPGRYSSKEREEQLIRWINDVASHADEVFLLGDIFDFWFEYSKVIPKGFVRLQAAIAGLCDTGIPVHLFIGNHDMWAFDYFTQELGVIMHRKPIQIERQGVQIFIAHGDGLGPGERTFKVIRKMFHSRLLIKMFQWLHPDIGIRIAHRWSSSSRASHGDIYQYHGAKKEYLIQFAEEYLHSHPEIDYFFFGHRHLVFNYLLSNGRSRYINTGDWLNFNSYAVMEQGRISLHSYQGEEIKIITNETPF